MLNPSERLDVLNSLVWHGCLQQARILPASELKTLTKRKLEGVVEGKVALEDQQVTLCVGIDERFPLSLPKIFLRPPDALGFLPHVEEDGYLCYLDSEGLLLDAENPLALLYEATELAVELLQAGVSEKNRWDFMDEFGAYWQRLDLHMQSLPAFISVDNSLRKVFVYKDGKSYVLVADDIETARPYFNSQGKELNSLTRYTALYIPLNQETFVFPPRPDQRWRKCEVQSLVRKNLSEANRQRFKSLTKKWKSEELIILGLPRPSGGMTLVGLLFSNVIGGHPLRAGNSQTFPIPLQIQRCDQAYLLPRGGARSQFSNFRVLVVGCGSVGGYVVVALVQAGITCLTLVDPDICTLENTFRHILGKQAQTMPKVLALKAEIENKYPYLSVTTHQTNIEIAIRDELVKLSNFDLVIFATGDHTVELYVNRLLHQQNSSPAAVFTWLEPYEIGGHTLLTHPGNPGCLQCLFISDSTINRPLYNRASFSACSQSFSKNDLGCNSSYTPYGALDAIKTAEQAVRLALDGLTKKEQGSPLVSWKGSDDSFIAAGFQASPRYKLTADQLHETRYSYVNDSCPVCGKLYK